MTYLAGQKTTSAGLNLLDPSTYPFVQVNQTSAQTAITNGGLALVSFQTKIIDTHTGFSTSTFLYTIPVGWAGWYDVDAIVHWPAASGLRYARLIQSGNSSAILINSGGTQSAISTNQFSGPVLCAAGDTLGVQVSQSSGGSLAPQVSSGYSSSFAARFRRAP